MSIREDLKAYLDGELDPARAAEVKAAIEADPALRKEAEELRLLGQEIHQLANEPAVFGLERTLTALHRRPTRRVLPMLRLAFAGSAGLLGVLTVVGATSFFMSPQAEYDAAVASDQVAGQSASVDAEKERKASMRAADADRVQTKGSDGSLKAEPQFQHKYGVTAPSTTDDRARFGLGSTGAANGGGRANTRSEPPAAVEHTAVPNAELVLKVHDAATANSNLTVIAEELGGQVEKTIDLAPLASDADKTTKTILRVPASNLSSAVDRLSRVDPSAEVLSSNVSGGTGSAGRTSGDEPAEKEGATDNQDVAGGMSELPERDASLRKKVDPEKPESEMATIMVTVEGGGDPAPAEQTRSQASTPAAGRAESHASNENPVMVASRAVFVWSPLWIPLFAGGWWWARRSGLV